MRTTDKASVSYRTGLIGDLRGNDQAQVEYIKASFEENTGWQKQSCS